MKSKNLIGLLVFVAVICFFSIKVTVAQKVNKIETNYLIKPGIGVGNVSIGMLRDKVISLAGKPVSSLDDGDQFTGFTVHYEDDRVTEIIVFSSQYKTAEGISIKSTSNLFLKTYSKSKMTCYGDEGAGSTTKGKIWDELDKGIAFDQQTIEGKNREIINSISIHRANMPAKIYGEIKPCNK